MVPAYGIQFHERVMVENSLAVRDGLKRCQLLVQASAAWPATLLCGVGPSKERSVEITWIWLVACSSRQRFCLARQNRWPGNATRGTPLPRLGGEEQEAGARQSETDGDKPLQTSTPAFIETLEIAGNEKKTSGSVQVPGGRGTARQFPRNNTKPGSVLTSCEDTTRNHDNALQKALHADDLLALTLRAHRQGDIE